MKYSASVGCLGAGGRDAWRRKVKKETWQCKPLGPLGFLSRANVFCSAKGFASLRLAPHASTEEGAPNTGFAFFSLLPKAVLTASRDRVWRNLETRLSERDGASLC